MSSMKCLITTLPVGTTLYVLLPTLCFCIAFCSLRICLHRSIPTYSNSGTIHNTYSYHERAEMNTQVTSRPDAENTKMTRQGQRNETEAKTFNDLDAGDRKETIARLRAYEARAVNANMRSKMPHRNWKQVAQRTSNQQHEQSCTKRTAQLHCLPTSPQQ